MTKRWIPAGAAAAALALAASPAQAQRAQDVEVRVVVPAETIRLVQREVQRLVDVTVPLVQREIAAAARSVAEAAARVEVRVGGWEHVAAQERRFRFEQVHRETHTLRLGPSGTLDLSNLTGDITVTGADVRETTVEVVRQSRGATEADARVGLDRVTVRVDHRGERATIEPRYPDDRRPNYSVSVAYVVRTPPGTRLSLRSLTGDISVEGVRGDLSIDGTSGDVTVTNAGRVGSIKTIAGDITVTGAETDGGIALGTVSGDVRVENVRARRLAGGTVSGDITARNVTADTAELKSMSGTIEFGGTLSASGRYELQSHAGDIRVLPAGGTGFDLQVSTFTGDIRVEPALALRTVATTRRSLRGTVGDGRAVVVITTFSGSVQVGRPGSGRR